MQTTFQESSHHTLALLPFELACQILTSEHLDAMSLVRSSQVCKSWKQMCDNDEIWRKAAQKWGYVSERILTVEDATRAKMDENGYFSQVKTWKDLCVAQEVLDAELGNRRRGMETQYPMSYSFHAAQSEQNQDIWQDLWSMKIDSEDGTLVSTGLGGGVRVTCLRTHELLWSIPPAITGGYPEIEVEKGFLVIWQAEGDFTREF